MAIVSNQVHCLKCDDRPFSAHRHDFRYCKCGSVAVDGGTEYLKRVGDLGPGSTKDISITMPSAIVNSCIEAVKWAHETGRNERGVAYAVLRALRDNGYDLNRDEEDV